jgi:hypothetical protein
VNRPLTPPTVQRSATSPIAAANQDNRPSFTHWLGRRHRPLGRLGLLSATALTTLVATAPAPTTVAITATGWAAGLLISAARAATTRYRIDGGRLQVTSGLLTRRTINIDLWRVANAELDRTGLQRLTSGSTVVLHLAHRQTGVPGRFRSGMTLRLPGFFGNTSAADADRHLRLMLDVIFVLRSSNAVKGIIQ